MTVVKVDATLADFQDLFASHFTKDGDKATVKLLLFLADRNAPDSDLTWCPDCNVAEPVIYSKLDAYALQGGSRDVLLLRAFVGDKPTWRDPAHPWRVDPSFSLKGVPTLLRWDSIKGEAVSRLEDDEANIPDKIDALLLD